MKHMLIASALALAITGCTAKQAAPSVEFKTEKVSLAGEGRGDYILVDEASNRLYVTHTSTVHILELDTLKQVGLVEGLVKAAGVALAGGKGFASDGGGNKIVVFDPATGKTIKTLHDGDKPDSIFFDQASGNVFVFNGESNSVSVVDPVKAEVIKTIALPDAPEFARPDGAGKAYVNLGEQHAIGVIDTLKGEVIGNYVLEGCEDPAALGIDVANQRLFSSCGNKVMKVVDATNGKIVASLPVGEDPDGIILDAAKKRVYVGARDGTWTIVDQKDANTYAVNQVFKIDEYAKTLALDPKTGRIFSSTADLVWPPKEPGKRLLPNAASGTFRLMVVSEK
jgi:YVTN family beta-propeller protein